MEPERFADRLGASVAAALGAEICSCVRLHGGDVAESYRFTLGDGRTVFAKTHHDPPPGFFTTEASGLAWLRAPDVIPVPAVLAVSDGDATQPAFLALEWIDEGPPAPNTDTELGSALAALHRAGAPCFGREDRRTTGSRALPNDPCDSWAEFYATRRLQPLAGLAAAQSALPADSLTLLDEVIARLDEFGVPDEPPARLHGDLWAGNRLIDQRSRSWLIDPAAHGGHREFDLAMMLLFGGYSENCFAAYHDAHPLAAGWRSRVPLHQLAPLIVHAIKFGGGYAGATRRALEATLSAA